MIVFFRHLVAVSQSCIISQSKRIPKMLKSSKLVAEQSLRNCPSLGSLVAQKRPDTRPKCVLTIVPAQSDQSAAVGTKSGPSGALRSFSPS